MPVARRHTGLPFDALGVGTDRSLGRVAALIDRALVRAWPTMFAYQFVYELTVSPVLDVASPDVASPDVASPDVASSDVASSDVAAADVASDQHRPG